MAAPGNPADPAIDAIDAIDAIGAPDAIDDESLPAPQSGDAAAVMRLAAEASERGARATMATVLARRGSAPSTPGQKLVLVEDGACVGTIGGGAVERAVLRRLVVALARDVATDDASSHPGVVETFQLGAGLGMCCGGAVEVLVESIATATPALLVGAGHIGGALAPLLARCGFAVTLVDEREAWAERAGDAPPRLRRVTGEFPFAGRGVPRRGAALAVTHDHRLDQRVVEWALREGFAFVGGVGSRAKAARTRARLQAKGFSAADVARVRMPLGLDLGARSPDEIAVSIVAELIAWRRGVGLARASTPRGAER